MRHQSKAAQTLPRINATARIAPKPAAPRRKSLAPGVSPGNTPKRRQSPGGATSLSSCDTNPKPRKPPPPASRHRPHRPKTSRIAAEVISPGRKPGEYAKTKTEPRRGDILVVMRHQSKAAQTLPRINATARIAPKPAASRRKSLAPGVSPGNTPKRRQSPGGATSLSSCDTNPKPRKHSPASTPPPASPQNQPHRGASH